MDVSVTNFAYVGIVVVNISRKIPVRVFGGHDGKVDCEGYLMINGPEDTCVFWTYYGTAIFTPVRPMHCEIDSGKWVSIYFVLDSLQFERLELGYGPSCDEEDDESLFNSPEFLNALYGRPQVNDE